VLLFFLFLNAAALAVGQLLFKSTAIRVGGLPFAAMVSKIAFVPSFYDRLPTLCGGNDALGLDPYQAPR